MENIRSNLEEVRRRINEAAQRAGRSPEAITLVGISKVQPIEKVQAAADAGLEHMGENRVQEASDKVPQIKGEITWHLVGHLQRNKAKRAVELFHMIESIDSDRLADEVSRRCVEAGKVMEVLLEVNLGYEEAKSGVEPSGLMALARHCAGLEGIAVKGIMVIPPFDPDPENSRPYFQRAYKHYQQLKEANIEGLDIQHISMGMSSDFEVAIEEGATIVRVGTAIFGARKCAY